MSELIPYDDLVFEPDDPPLIPDFAPVPRKTQRVHGWTPRRQRDFISALADSGSVTAAAARVNMTPEAAYYLRRAEGAESFREAWEAAVEIGVRSLTDIAIDRARHGVAVPVYHDGKIVGEKRWYNDRLLMFILKHHLPERYGAPKRLMRGGRAPQERNMEQVRDSILTKLAAISRHRAPAIAAAKAAERRALFERLDADPAKRAAWELLNEKALETLLAEDDAEAAGALATGGDGAAPGE